VSLESPKIDKNTPATEFVPDPPIFESIHHTDMASIYSIETKGYAGFVAEIARTKNTVCGRHPIGVMMAGLEATFPKDEDTRARFRFARLETSSDVNTVSTEQLVALGYEKYGSAKLKEAGVGVSKSGHFGGVSTVNEKTGEEISDSSVSYASAYAIF
jgi:predicted class III extradiol MEMO1 family dioxygenase